MHLYELKTLKSFRLAPYVRSVYVRRENNKYIPLQLLLDSIDLPADSDVNVVVRTHLLADYIRPPKLLRC